MGRFDRQRRLQAAEALRTVPGGYVSDAGRQACVPGDFLFAPAGVAQRFEEFSDDSAVWVLFYGPEGGERNQETNP